MNIVRQGEIIQPAHGWLVIEQNMCLYSRLSICNAQLRNRNGLSGSFSKVSMHSFQLLALTTIFQDLHISIRERGVLSAFHPDAIDLYSICSDLKRVCWTLYDPGFRLNKNVCHSCEPFIPS